MKSLIELLKEDHRKLRSNFPILTILDNFEPFRQDDRSTFTPKKMEIDFLQNKVTAHYLATTDITHYKALQAGFLGLNPTKTGYKGSPREFTRYEGEVDKEHQRLAITLDVYHRP